MIDNPYWDIVRRNPGDPITRQYENRWVRGGFSREARAGESRDELAGRYAWAIPTPEAIEWIVKQLNGRSLVELGAGRGYWAWQLAQHGVDVVAYDPKPPDTDTSNHFFHRFHRGLGDPEHPDLTVFHPVQIGDHMKVLEHQDRALFLCWPTYDDPWAHEALAAYTGDLVVYCGEWGGGCCADENFFDLLARDWESAGEYEGHVQWSGIHDVLEVYRPKTGITPVEDE